VQTFRLVKVFLIGSYIFLTTRFGRNLRLVLRLEWLTLWPVVGRFPHFVQTRDMGVVVSNLQLADCSWKWFLICTLLESGGSVICDYPFGKLFCDQFPLFHPGACDCSDFS